MDTQIETHRIYFQNIIVSLLELRVWHSEKEIHFTLSELRLLLAFLADPFKTISAEELVRAVDLTSLESLYGLIFRVRTLLGQQYIVTQDCGYSFVDRSRALQGEKNDRKAN